MDNKKRSKKTVADTVCRVHKFGGYAVLSNCFVRSTNLGCPAIGLLGRVLDLPPEWNFTKAGLIAVCADGETAVESALADLEKWGYVKKTIQMPDESPTGRIRCIYDFYEYSAKDSSIPQYDYEMETFTVDNATLNRVKKDSNFTMISSKLLRNKEIRNKLLGFLLKVLSLPNYWNFSMSGLVAICKEGRTAVHNAVGKLIDMGYLVRTKLLPNESMNNCFEYVYSFFDKPISKEEADEIEAETRRKAITIREGGRTKKYTSSSVEKQGVENLYLDSQPPETLPSENHGQYNTKDTIQKNSLLSNKSSIIPSAPTSGAFHKNAVESSGRRMTDRYDQEEINEYTEVVRENIGYLDLGEWLCADGRDGFKEADEIVGFIVDEVCSPLPYGSIKGQSFPRSVIQSQMLKADINTVESALLKMADVDGIKDFRKYFISTLYNEVLTYNFNEGCESRWADHAVARDFGYPA